jgi:3-oxoacyl-[acyl-carrier protein] reductase
VAINVKAPLFIVKHSLHRTREGGRIINVSSVGTRAALPPQVVYLVVYLALNGAIDSLTRNLAWEGP